MPGMPPSSYSECLPQGLQIPNNLSITRVMGGQQMAGGYTTAHAPINANNKTMNIIANAPWMNQALGPGPHMHPNFSHMSASMMEEMAKKKRGRPRKTFDGLSEIHISQIWHRKKSPICAAKIGMHAGAANGSKQDGTCSCSTIP